MTADARGAVIAGRGGSAAVDATTRGDGGQSTGCRARDIAVGLTAACKSGATVTRSLLKIPPRRSTIAVVR
jgi:hypothetical protein